MTATESPWGTGANAEAIAAWDGPLFDRFARFRHIFTTGLGAHGDEAMRLYPPPAGASVLDIGCGFGDTTQQLAALVGPSGRAIGVDAAPRFIEAARTEAAEAGVENIGFEVCDVESVEFEERFDTAFSRMGTMFFASPVAALRNVRRALVPGGRLVMVVWRKREDNPWLYRAQTIVEGIVQRPTEYDEPTCGPGPFSMSGADTTSDILIHAGFEGVTFHRVDLPILLGADVDEALAAAKALGPAAEILRLLGDRAAEYEDRIDAALRSGLEEFARDDGVWGEASTWIVAAAVPAE